MVGQALLCATALDMHSACIYRREMAGGELSQRILAVRRELRMNQADFGKAVGVNQTTVSRWESGAVPDVIALGKIASLAGLPISHFTQADFDQSPSGPRLFIKGEVAAGVWKEAFEWDRELWVPYQGGTHFDAPMEARFGLSVVGESMNKVYPPGTILDCVSCLHADLRQFKSGQRVIVVRKRVDGEVEATVKEFQATDEGAWLVPRSNNPAFQAPIPLSDGDPSIEEVAIVAIVKGSYRPEPT